MTEKENHSPLEPNSPTGNLSITDRKDGSRRIRVQFDITYKGHEGKIPVGETQTEPDMTLRLGQLLERHSRGRDIPMQQPLFFDTEIPTFSDLTDISRYRDQLERRLEETKGFIEAEQEELKAAQAAKKTAKQAKPKGPENPQDPQTPPQKDHQDQKQA